MVFRAPMYASLRSFSRRPKSGKGEGDRIKRKNLFVEGENLSFVKAVDKET